MKLREVLARGLKDGYETTWALTKIIVPVYILLTFLKYTPLLGWIAHTLEPITNFFGLPGEAALPFVIGVFLGIYPAVGAVQAIGLSGRELTILALIILIFHSLPMEGLIGKKTGINGWLITLVRFICVIILGVIVNIFV